MNLFRTQNRVPIRAWWDPVGPSSSLRWDPVGLGAPGPDLPTWDTKPASVGRLDVPYTPFGFYNVH